MINKKTVILIVDVPYINSFCDDILEFDIFILNYPLNSYYLTDIISKFSSIKLINLNVSVRERDHFSFCEAVNDARQEQLYSSLNKFDDVILISEFGGISYGSLNVPEICKNLYESGKNITLCYIFSSPFMGKKRNDMGKIALEYTMPYIKNRIQINVDWFKTLNREDFSAHVSDEFCQVIKNLVS